MIEQPTPAVCPHCNSLMTGVVCGASLYFSADNKRDVETGKAILGGEWDKGQPSWACLKCVPAWAEVHRLAWQDYEWQTAKEQAIEASDFQLAAQFRDRQYEIRGPLQKLVARLVANS